MIYFVKNFKTSYSLNVSFLNNILVFLVDNSFSYCSQGINLKFSSAAFIVLVSSEFPFSCLLWSFSSMLEAFLRCLLIHDSLFIFTNGTLKSQSDAPGVGRAWEFSELHCRMIGYLSGESPDVNICSSFI